MLLIQFNSKRVFLLGPSHHAYIDGCSLSKCSTYETPLGNLKLDREGNASLYELQEAIYQLFHLYLVIEELHSTGKFRWMSQTVDEEEHSLEMHLPFTYKIFEE
jgi:AmmeMemoRadiSam system protein B